MEPGAKAVGVMVETKWLGRSANPLYHVNKELSVLAAVSLFEVGTGDLLSGHRR